MSTTRCDVSTLPPTTAGERLGSLAAGGLSRQVGRMILTGSSTPLLSGMSSPIRQRKTYNTAAVTMARLALRFVARTGPVPVKSTVASSLFLSIETVIKDPSSRWSVCE